MKQEIYIKFFVRFLKKENVYNDYIRFWKSYNGKKYKNIQEWVMMTHHTSFISGAFAWSSEVWPKLHRKWTIIASQLRRNLN